MRRLLLRGATALLALGLLAPPSTGHHPVNTAWFVESTEKIKVPRLGNRTQPFPFIRVFFDADNDLFQLDYLTEFVLNGTIEHTNRGETKFRLYPDEEAHELQAFYLEEVLREDRSFFDGVATTVDLEELRWTIKGKVNKAQTKLRITSKAKSRGTAANNLSSVRFNVKYVEKYSADAPEEE